MAMVRVVGCQRFAGQVSVGFGLCKSHWILQKSSPDFVEIFGFRWIWPDFKEILVDLNEIRLDLKDILADLNEIKPDLEEIRRDLNVKSAENRVTIFRCVSRSGWLKIGFSCSNPSTDLSVLGFMGRDPLLTVADVRLAGFQAGSAGLNGLVEF